MRLALPFACLASLGSAANACSYVTEEQAQGWSDAVIVGVADCDSKRGTCKLRPSEIVKDSVSFGDGPNIYLLRFEPGSIHRWAESGEIMSCVVPWEPASAQVKGRFYLSRREGQWWVRNGPRPSEF